MAKQQKLIATLVEYTQRGNTYLMEYAPNNTDGSLKQGGNLTVLVPSSLRIKIFPDGIPALGDPYLITVNITEDGAYLVSSFDLNAEVIPAEDIPQFTELVDYETKGQKQMQLKELHAERDAQIEAIRQDESLVREIEQVVDEDAKQATEEIKRRQAGVGIESFFEDADEPTLKAETPKPQENLTQQVVESTRTVGD